MVTPSPDVKTGAQKVAVPRTVRVPVGDVCVSWAPNHPSDISDALTVPGSASKEERSPYNIVLIE